jgi:predicted DCC family thiol-disulfide oxidoreductase YuxK
MTNHLQKLTLFYDGACPLCQAEILFLSGRNQDGLIDFIDINMINIEQIQPILNHHNRE